ncbi:MAG: hypothetical protein R2828_15030 [Saprospiraceae bacterium]
MKPTILSVIAILLCSSLFLSLLPSASGQGLYLPGKVTLENGETINCNIKYLNWENSPTKITIQRGDSIHILKENDIKKFEVTRKDEALEVYEKVIFDKDISPTALAELTPSREPKLTKDTALLKVLIYGSINLYYFNDGWSKTQFVIRKNAELVTLINNSFLVDVYSTTIVSSTKYKTQLGQLINDCDQIVSSDLVDLKYRQKDLTQIINKYNSCQPDQVENFQYKEESTKSNFYIFAGLDYQHLRFEDFGTNNSLSSIDFKASIKPQFGVGLGMVVPRTNNSISLAATLGLQFFHFSGDLFLQNQMEEITIAGPATISGYTTFLNFTTNYKLSVKKNAPYLFMGLSLSVPKLSTNELFLQETKAGVTSESTFAVISATRPISAGIFGGVGKTMGAFRAAFCYSLSDGFSADVNLAARVYSLSFILAHDF